MKERQIYNMAVIEMVRNLRTVKRQLMLLKTAPLTFQERQKLLAAMESVSDEFAVFKL